MSAFVGVVVGLYVSFLSLLGINHEIANYTEVKIPVNLSNEHRVAFPVISSPDSLDHLSSTSTPVQDVALNKCLMNAKTKYLSGLKTASISCSIGPKGWPDSKCVQKTSAGTALYSTLYYDDNDCYIAANNKALDSQGVPMATIDPDSLLSAPGTVTLSGSATVPQLSVDVESNSAFGANIKSLVYSNGARNPIQVVNGHWAVTIGVLQSGNYPVHIRDYTTYALLTTETLAVDGTLESGHEGPQSDTIQATFDTATLTSPDGNATVSGTMKGITQGMVFIGSGESLRDYPVESHNGRWSLPLISPDLSPLAPGSYLIRFMNNDIQELARGTLVIGTGR